MRHSLVVLCWVLACACSAGAQSLLSGTVVDPDGKPIAGAKLALANHAGAAVASSQSESAGDFRFLSLEAGDYRLRVTATGFYDRTLDVGLRPRQALQLTVQMQPVQTNTEHVEVKGESVQVDPELTGSAHVLSHSALQALPAPERRDVPTLAQNLAPGAVLSHDNFVHVRGNELSLHEFINGVAFLDNSHQHFTPGISPEIFGSVNLMTGGFPAEYGNRFGGILDISTRSGRDLDGHGSVSLGLGTVQNNDAAAEYGGKHGNWGYYLFAGGFSSDRFLNPPQREELHDFGYGVRGALQLDYAARRDTWKLLLTGGSTSFQLPNTTDQQALGRTATRDLLSGTAILGWQHTFSSKALLSTSVYGRSVGDNLNPTSDAETMLGDGGRTTRTTGIKSDLLYASGRHTFKFGVDLTRLQLREHFLFDPQAQASEIDAFDFRGNIDGGQVGMYAQDHVTLGSFAFDLGLRWDQFDVVNTYAQVSPRAGIAYHVRRTGTVLHAAYNRFFSPPPIEYLTLANFLGTTAPDPDQRVGDVRPYRQHYFEVGVTQPAGEHVVLEVSAYRHYGDDSYENTELGDTRLFLPTNFASARSGGVEFAVNFRQFQHTGFSARLQYAAARTYFYGPIAGGFTGGELIDAGERILPAFDQIHTGTIGLMYRHKWRGLWTGLNTGFGSGTPFHEGESRLPGHVVFDLAGGLDLWRHEHGKVSFEFDAINIGNRVYAIAKESETTPLQYAPRRVISGRLRWSF